MVIHDPKMAQRQDLELGGLERVKARSCVLVDVVFSHLALRPSHRGMTHLLIASMLSYGFLCMFK
jgi:hypothetical protein